LPKSTAAPKKKKMAKPKENMSIKIQEQIRENTGKLIWDQKTMAAETKR